MTCHVMQQAPAERVLALDEAPAPVTACSMVSCGEGRASARNGMHYDVNAM